MFPSNQRLFVGADKLKQQAGPESYLGQLYTRGRRAVMGMARPPAAAPGLYTVVRPAESRRSGVPVGPSPPRCAGR